MPAFIEMDETIDAILHSYKTALGGDYDKYRNHVYRVFNLTLLLSNTEGDDYKALEIATAFHDIGIWTAKTFDYLEPSIALSNQYLNQNGLSGLASEVNKIINNHHKLSSYTADALVEAFRKADLIDLSFGLFSFGIKREQLKELNRLFPSLGFHRFIVWQAIKNMVRHPLNPLPMMKR